MRISLLYVTFLWLLTSLTVADKAQSGDEHVKATVKHPAGAVRFRVVRATGNDTHYLLDHASRTLHRVPNTESLKELLGGLGQQSAPALSPQAFSAYAMGPLLPSLHHHSPSHDERVRVKVQKALTLSPSSAYWNASFHWPKMLNPALANWQGRLLLVWRRGLYIKGFHFSWLDRESSLELSRQTYLGIGQRRSPPIAPLAFNGLLEDPRLVPLRTNGSLLVLYTAKVSLFSPAKQCYFLADVQPDAQGPGQPGVVFHPSVLLDRPESPTWESGQKNWVPFQPQDVPAWSPLPVLFIRQISPMHVVGVTGVGPNNTALLRDVVLPPPPSEQSRRLPWRADYGLPLRGGTPAVLLPRHGLFLAFFHSVAHLHGAHAPKMRTYFAGAYTFCSSHPYTLQATSAFPVLNASFYEGRWVEGGLSNLDYVFFPMGLVPDPADATGAQGEHVLLSAGHQDQSGVVLRLHVEGLLASMQPVQGAGQCGPQGK